MTRAATGTHDPDGAAAPVVAAAPTYDGWMALARTEYDRLDDVLRALSPADWAAPTDCGRWTVHDVVAHLAGAAWSTARVRELLRQALAGRRAHPGLGALDALNEVQVDERRGAAPDDLVAELTRAAAAGLRRRSRLPAAARALRLPLGPLGVRPLGYLMGRIYTRDAWMHRIDVTRATGRPLLLTGEHDGVLVADVVTEWLAVHGRPVELTLTGPAGGSWASGRAADREHLTCDAVTFCRGVSGRGTPDGGLLAVQVPF